LIGRFFNVIPDAAERRSGIHAGAFSGKVQAWIPGQARDDRAVPVTARSRTALRQTPGRFLGLVLASAAKLR
jgi:hypothetical protein